MTETIQPSTYTPALARRPTYHPPPCSPFANLWSDSGPALEPCVGTQFGGGLRGGVCQAASEANGSPALRYTHEDQGHEVLGSCIGREEGIHPSQNPGVEAT